MYKSPYKFLDSFTKDDREIFFGRDRETEELYSRVFESRILLVYGTSGTGKSSLINCGLANKFNDSDWLPVNVRRGTDINQSLFEALYKNALTRTIFEKTDQSKPYDLEKLLRSVYLDQFKPVFLIFDQFEELFIFGRKDEKNELVRNVAKVIASDIQCRFIFLLREEYLAGITEFERLIPSFMGNRIRIEKMTRQNAVQTIEGPCRISKIPVDEGFAMKLLEKLNPDTPEVELTWLQVFLDKLMRIPPDNDHPGLTVDLIGKAGDVKDILGGFLEEQLSHLDEPETGLSVLKSFVSVKGTKNQVTEEEILEYTGTFGKKIDSSQIRELIQKFIRLRILKDKDESGRYELRHDSLASKIYEKITFVEKELLEVKFFIENAYDSFEKRNLLLSAEDLKYIAPYEDKLFLNEKNSKFISLSKRELHKRKRRRQNVLASVAAVIFAVLSFFTVWALKERSNAVAQQELAEDQKNAALAAKSEADRSRQDAVSSKKIAEENEKIALDARSLSEKARQEALAAKENALQQKARAEALSVIANEQADNAERERKTANDQKILAQLAEEKAKRMGFLSLAQTLALKSVIMEKDPELMGLLAVQAYNFNRQNGGEPGNPVIYEALDKAFITLDSTRHFVLTGSKNEIRSLAENERGLISADLEGNVLQWNKDGTKNIIASPQSPSFISFIRASANGKYIITSYENGRLVLTDLSGNSRPDQELTGHSGPVRTASWSSDGSFVATAGTDSALIVWSTGSGSPSQVKRIKTRSVVRACVFCTGNDLISAQEDGSVLLWDSADPDGRLLYSSETEKPVCLAWNDSKKILVAGCSNGIILTLKTDPGQKVNTRYMSHTTGIDQAVFNSDYSLLATAGWDKSIRLYNCHVFFELANPVEGAVNLNSMNQRIRSLLFTRDDRLVAAMSDKSIRFWETSPQKLIDMIRQIVGRDMTKSEWADMVGQEIPYEKTFSENSKTGGI